MMWMNNMTDNLKSIPINKLIIPGTHNSAINTLDFSVKSETNKKILLYGQKTSFFYPINNILKRWTITQEKTIHDQLLNGIRYFDIRISYLNNEIFATHTYVAKMFVHVLDEFVEFMEKINSEIIIIRVRKDFENKKSFDNYASVKLNNILLNHKINKYIYPIKFYKQNQLNIFPSYNEFIKSRKMVLYIFDSNTLPSESIVDFILDDYIVDDWIDTSNLEKKMNKINDTIEKIKMDNNKIYEMNLILTPQDNDIINDVVCEIIDLSLILCLYLFIIFGLAVFLTRDISKNKTFFTVHVRNIYIFVLIIIIVAIIVILVFYSIKKCTFLKYNSIDNLNRSLIDKFPVLMLDPNIVNNLNVIIVDFPNNNIINNIINLNNKK